MYVHTRNTTKTSQTLEAAATCKGVVCVYGTCFVLRLV